jgi:hypothetical protein
MNSSWFEILDVIGLSRTEIPKASDVFPAFVSSNIAGRNAGLPSEVTQGSELGGGSWACTEGINSRTDWKRKTIPAI